jgi:leucyl-tRNA synthetase
MQRYNPKDIETKWQKKWEDDAIYVASENPDKPKKYVLEYFPYPSGAAMHVGHVRNYTIGDAVARYARMKGFNVLHPMGWDAFGLPAENYAIKNNISPQQAIAENTAKFKRQLMQMGFSYDWTREVNSSDPSYYKWTQWFFELLLERGLAYQKDSLQWWCDFDKTVLANEQVEAGKCWRCGNPVTKKALKQWFFKITDYADRLVEDLDKLDWSDAIKSMQRNWIGKSKGAEIDFAVADDANYVLLHGFMGSPDEIFFPTAKQFLEAHRAQVSVPALPDSDKPNADVQADYVVQNIKFDENTVLLGHSYGTVTALKILEKIDTPIKRLVMVSGFAEPGFLDHERNFETTTNWDFDFERIKRNAQEIIILRPENDSAVPRERAEYLKAKLGGEIVDFIAEDDHTCGPNEPTVIDYLRQTIKVFTTRPDTLFGATFMVLAPEHELVTKITHENHREAVDHYKAKAAAKSDVERQEVNREKTGVFTGAYAVNPANGSKIPVWIADYVLTGYGTGAIMAVPAHDDRDAEFAKKFDLPIIRVVQNDAKDDEYSHAEGVMVNSGEYDGQPSAEVRVKIVEDLTAKNVGEAVVNYKIRDWLISRQRYWGAPIPIIHCDEHGAVPVPKDQLPVVLPEVSSYQPNGEGTSVLAGVEDWVNTTCPTCGKPAKRETDTMDGFACSSWYFLRFADPRNAEQPFSDEKVKFWLPVDDYIGGAEHAVMHLLYARMWTKVMHDAGMIDFDEPFLALRNQGMILAPDGRKMSKSWGNTITPDEIIDQGYGADAIRVMELFIGPWDQMANWSVEGMGGCYRFLARIWTLVHEFTDSTTVPNPAAEKDLRFVTHKMIKKVSNDLDNMGFNTAIAAQMEAVNELYRVKAEDNFAAHDAWKVALETLVQLVAPFAPHIAEELWQVLGNEGSVHLSSWPEWNDDYLVESEMTIAVQINGKLRGEITVSTDAAEAEIVTAAQSSEKVASHLTGKEIRKTIYVAGKLVNFVAT